MKNLLWLALLVCFGAQAGMQNVEVLNLNSGIRSLKNRLEGTRYLNRTQTFAFEDATRNYENGDFVILWGVGSSTSDQTITETEYKNIWKIMNYLNGKDFRVILNVRSTGADLEDALSSESSSVVLFSSHGNESAFYDFNHNAIDYNVFKNKSKSVYQFILSACYGSIALRDNYVIPDDLKVYAWSGLTNSTELQSFLMGDSWTGFEGKPAAN
jgi:hypothetical protein